MKSERRQFVTFGLLAVLVTAASLQLAREVRGQSEKLVPAIVFASTRDHLEATSIGELFLALEIYVSDLEGGHVRRLTNNRANDSYPVISPDGRRIVFESGRLRETNDPDNQADLFIMNADGSEQRHLIRGSSATWSPDGKFIAYHASASGKGKYKDIFPGAATTDSDIFILDVDGFLRGEAVPMNLTASSHMIDEDPDWSPDGATITYSSHKVDDDHKSPTSSEIYQIRADGKGARRRLTKNREEERASSWSPDGKRIALICKDGGKEFQVCTMNADGSKLRALTKRTGLTHTWTPDGRKIIFHRSTGESENAFQLFSIDLDGTNEKQLTRQPGLNAFPYSGLIWVKPGN